MRLFQPSGMVTICCSFNFIVWTCDIFSQDSGDQMTKLISINSRAMIQLAEGWIFFFSLRKEYTLNLH